MDDLPEQMRRDRRTSDVFENMLQNRMVNFLAKINENKKNKEGKLNNPNIFNIEEELKINEAKKLIEKNSVLPIKPLPPSTTDSKLVQNYETIKEIIDLVNEENICKHFRLRTNLKCFYLQTQH